MRSEARAFAPQTKTEHEIVQTAEKKPATVLDFSEKKEQEDQRDIVKEKLIGFFEQNGVLDYVGGKTIFDVDGFLHDSNLIKKLWGLSVRNEEGESVRGNLRLVFEKLADMEVISKHDYLESIASGKEAVPILLCNIPESIEDAFDVEKIRSKKYYLNYWDLRDHSREKQINWQYEITAKNGEKIDAREMALATELVRNYDLRRDAQDNASVLDAAKGERTKLDAKFIKQYIGTFGNSTADSIFNSPGKYLSRHCPNILKKDILRIDDFRMASHENSGEILRKEEPIGNNTHKMIKGRSYYIGRESFEFSGEKVPKKDLKVVVLDGNKAGIVKKNIHGGEDLICVLNLLEEPEKASSLEKLGKEATRSLMEPWLATKDNPKREDESAQGYAERMRKIQDWNIIKKISTDFSYECGIGIHNDLSWREQQWLISAAYELDRDYPRLLEFGKRFGIEGLRTFVSCEYDFENAKKILDLGERMNESGVKHLFSQYAKSIEHAVAIAELVGNGTKQEGADFTGQLQEALLRRIQDIFIATHQKHISDKDFQPNESSKSLEAINLFMEIATSLNGGMKYDVAVDNVKSRENNYFFNVLDKESGYEYGMKIFIRPVADGNGQARINFELNFDTQSPNDEMKEFFHQETYYRKKNQFKEESVLRIGIDRDEHDGIAEVSLDLGRSGRDCESFVRTGDKLGNLLAKIGEKEHHNPDSFNKKLADQETFARIAGAFEKFLREKIIASST